MLAHSGCHPSWPRTFLPEVVSHFSASLENSHASTLSPSFWNLGTHTYWLLPIGNNPAGYDHWYDHSQKYPTIQCVVFTKIRTETETKQKHQPYIWCHNYQLNKSKVLIPVIAHRDGLSWRAAAQWTQHWSSSAAPSVHTETQVCSTPTGNREVSVPLHL